MSKIKSQGQTLNEDAGDSSTRRKFLGRITAAAFAIGSPMILPRAEKEPTMAALAATSSPDPVIFDALPQFYTVDDVPTAFFKDQRYIYAFVERIIDGDTIRVRHVPGYGLGRSAPQPLQQRGIANETLSIRVYAVDTPETGKNKRQTSQPYGDEAEAFTRELVYHKMVKITFLRRDQYRRAVAQVETVGGGILSSSKDLSMELAKAGLAELYTGGGAEYNGNRGDFEKAIGQAQRQKKGIWSLGDDRVSASEYKRAQRQGTNVPIASNHKKTEKKPLLAASTYDNTGATPATASSQRGPFLAAFGRKKRNKVAQSMVDVAVTGLELTLGA